MPKAEIKEWGPCKPAVPATSPNQQLLIAVTSQTQQLLIAQCYKEASAKEENKQTNRKLMYWCLVNTKEDHIDN